MTAAAAKHPVAALERWAHLRGTSAFVVVGSLQSAAGAAFADRVVRGAALPLPTDAKDPRHADVLIVIGRVAHKLAPHLVALCERLPAHARVLAFDDDDDDVYACARADAIIAVDVLVRGIPPDEGAVARALTSLFAPRTAAP